MITFTEKELEEFVQRVIAKTLDKLGLEEGCNTIEIIRTEPKEKK